MNALTLIVPIDDLIAEHNAATGDRMTRYSLAKELVKSGSYKNHKAALNALNYMASGKSKGLDFVCELYLCERFGKQLSGIYKRLFQ